MNGHQFEIGDHVVYAVEDDGTGCDYRVVELLPPNRWGGLEYRIRGVDGEERVVVESQLCQPRDCD